MERICRPHRRGRRSGHTAPPQFSCDVFCPGQKQFTSRRHNYLQNNTLRRFHRIPSESTDIREERRVHLDLFAKS